MQCTSRAPMDTPLIQKTYAFAVVAARWGRLRAALGAPRDIDDAFIQSCLAAGARIEQATGASNRAEFLMQLRMADSSIRDAKYWLRLLDDLDEIAPEDATELHDAAEEAHRIVLACIRTAKGKEQ